MKKEYEIVAECKSLLDIQTYAQTLIYKIIHIPNPTGGMQERTRAVSMRGHADCEIYLPKMKMLHIEFKRSDGGIQSEAQKIWQKDLESIGHKYFIVKSRNELEAILIKHKVVLYRWDNGLLVPIDDDI